MRVGRKRNTGVLRVGIELPSLNETLVEVQKELAKFMLGAKDMAIKNKNVWKSVKATQEQPNKAHQRITQLESSAPMTQPVSTPASHATELQIRQEEVEAQEAITAKEKRSTELDESKIDQLRSEL